MVGGNNPLSSFPQAFSCSPAADAEADAGADAATEATAVTDAGQPSSPSASERGRSPQLGLRLLLLLQVIK